MKIKKVPMDLLVKKLPTIDYPKFTSVNNIKPVVDIDTGLLCYYDETDIGHTEDDEDVVTTVREVNDKFKRVMLLDSIERKTILNSFFGKSPHTPFSIFSESDINLTKSIQKTSEELLEDLYSMLCFKETNEDKEIYRLFTGRDKPLRPIDRYNIILYQRLKRGYLFSSEVKFEDIFSSNLEKLIKGSKDKNGRFCPNRKRR